MTPRNWGLRECLVAACLALVAAGGLVGLLVWDRRLFLLAVGWMCSLWWAYRIPNRNLIAELEAAQMRLSAYNASDSRADLAEAPLTPPGGHKPVEMYDQDTEPAQLDPIYPRLCITCGQPQHHGQCDPEAVAARQAEAHAAIIPACRSCSGHGGGMVRKSDDTWDWEMCPVCRGDGQAHERPLATGGVVPSSSAVTFSESDGCVVPSPYDELAYIRGYYGVPAQMDGEVVVDGRPGLIVGARDAHLLVEFDEDETLPCHPTWRVEYRTPDPAEQPFVHTPCGTPISVLDDGAEWCPTCGTFIDPELLPDLDASDGPRSLPTPRVSD